MSRSLKNHKSEELPNAIIAVSGLSLAGKTTTVVALNYAIPGSVVISENLKDPYRSTTAGLNRLFKEKEPLKSLLDAFRSKFPEYVWLLEKAERYVNSFAESMNITLSEETKKQMFLTYFFATGRSKVNDLVKEEIKHRPVILDRWWADGCAYQARPPEFPWQRILDINLTMGMYYPNLQIYVACPIEDILLRKAYRQKIGLGTAGQMSSGKEQAIYDNFRDIHYNVRGSGIPSIWLENNGIPQENLVDQIRQFVPTFQWLYGEIKTKWEDIIQRHCKFEINSMPDDPEKYWLEPERLARMQAMQTVKV